MKPNEEDQPDQEQNQSSAPNDEQQKPLGRHDNSTQEDYPVFKPAKSGKALKIFTIIIIVLLFALLGIMSWLWWQERYGDSEEATSTPESSQQQEEEQTATCPENFGVYANASLGVEFCYPDAWGEVEANDAKFADADTGQRWRLSFADKTQVNLGLVSEDWSTEAARELTCVDPAVQTLPAFSPFSTEWNVETEIDTDPPQPSSATRGIEKENGRYLIDERVDELLTNGACITAYTVIDNPTYPFATSTYYYSADDVSVQMYMDNPEDYVSASERNDFYTFAKSVKAYEE